MKIAIAGYGAEGKSNYNYYNNGSNDVVIVDEHEVADAPVDASVISGQDAFSRLNGYDLVVRTAGLAPRKIITDGKIWSSTNEFFDKCPAPIIGVTGSKGKGTTSSLIASILREAGKTVHLVGNIGIPALDILGEIKSSDIVVYEMSSFQLWDLKKSPHIAVVLMIEPDHLDVHADFDEYVAAKANIRKYQTEQDVCFYHPTNVFSKQIAMTSDLQNAHAYNDASDKLSVYIDDGNFVVGDRVICSIEVVQLPGVHNLENACAAICAALCYVSDWSAVERGLRAFHGLDHRLKFVREVTGVKYYDDSIATTPGSAIAAMKAFLQPKVMILGGSSKGADFTEVAKVATQQSVISVVVIGAEANAIEKVFRENTMIKVINLGEKTDMTTIVKEASAQANSGDVVILSPACASFGMFKNYSDRGDQFIAAVEQL